MPLLDGNNRPLPFELREELPHDNQVDDSVLPCGLPDFPEDPDEKTTVVMNISLNEFVALASAVDIGRDIAYGDQSHLIWWLWSTVIMCADFCSLVAECIETNETTQNAIASAITNNINIQNAINGAFNPEIPGGTATDEYKQQDMMNATVECDFNAAWGHILDGLIERSMQRVKDVLDQIELTTDNQEMLAATIEAMPIFGVTAKAIGVSGIIQWFDNVRSFLADAFEAGDTLEKREQMACDLFCIWQVNCSLSFEQVSNYFYTNAADNFPTFENAFIDIASLILSMANPTELTGEFVVDCLLGCMFGFQSFINDWFGVQIGSASEDLLFGVPSSTWSEICEDCPEACQSFDFTTSDYAPEWRIRQNTPPEDMSEYVPGVGYTPREQAGTNWENQIYIIGPIHCPTLEYVYSCPNTPTQVALFWCNSSFSVLSLAANLTAASGTVTDSIDLSALTPPLGATGFLLVSGNESDGDFVVTWKEANFS